MPLGRPQPKSENSETTTLITRGKQQRAWGALRSVLRVMCLSCAYALYNIYVWCLYHRQCISLIFLNLCVCI